MSHVTPETTLARADLIIRHEGLPCLPVVSNGYILGIISSEDIRKAIGCRKEMGSLPLIVGNFMTAPVKLIEGEGPIELSDLLRSLLEETETRAFVATKDGRSRDILLKAELLERLCRNGGEEFRLPPPRRKA